MNNLLETFASIIGNNGMLVSFVVSFLAGVITACMPCFLTTFPLIIGYVGSVDGDKKAVFKISAIFALGNAITFTVLGILASFIGSVMAKGGSIWYIFLGIIMILMALQICNVFTFIKPTYLTAKNKKKGYLGAVFAGMLAGIFSSPCATPILVALLAIVAESGSLLYGIALLLLYALGNGVVIILIGMFLNKIKEIRKKESYAKISNVINYIIAALMVMLGLYMFYLGF